MISNHQLLPEWQRKNAQDCESAMLALLPSKGLLRSLAMNAILPGRKLRASLALQCLRWIGNPHRAGSKNETLLQGLARTEFLHSASCILDDIIDGDTVRRGQPVFHIREGLPQALLTAQELIGIACSVQDSNSGLERRIQDILISSVRRTVHGEACDSFPFKSTVAHIPVGVELERAYLEKTTPSFEAAHRIAALACALPEEEANVIAEYGLALGAYYQCSNDYHDWFSLDSSVRGIESEDVLVSLCIPSIVAFSFDPGIGNLIGTRIKRSEFALLCDHLRQQGIEAMVREKLNAAHQLVYRLFPLKEKPNDLVTLLNVIDTKEFWGYKYLISQS